MSKGLTLEFDLRAKKSIGKGSILGWIWISWDAGLAMEETLICKLEKSIGKGSILGWIWIIREETRRVLANL
jgi:hypothetical protein